MTVSARMFVFLWLFLGATLWGGTVGAKTAYIIDNTVTYGEKVRSVYTGKTLNGKYNIEVWIYEVRLEAPNPEQVYAFRYRERHSGVDIVDGVIDLDIGSETKLPFFDSAHASLIIVITENRPNGMEVARITPPRLSLKRVEIPDSKQSR